MAPEPIRKDVQADDFFQRAFRGGKPLTPAPPPPPGFLGTGADPAASSNANNNPLPIASNPPSGETIAPQEPPEPPANKE